MCGLTCLVCPRVCTSVRSKAVMITGHRKTQSQSATGILGEGWISSHNNYWGCLPMETREESPHHYPLDLPSYGCSPGPPNLYLAA